MSDTGLISRNIAIDICRYQMFHALSDTELEKAEREVDNFRREAHILIWQEEEKKHPHLTMEQVVLLARVLYAAGTRK